MTHHNKLTVWPLIATACTALIYCSLRLSPSSYSLILKENFKIEDSGLLWGTPRNIRSDEWSHSTPWTQAVVNNRFQRYNSYSPYHEDFRTVFPMPIWDWALVFKPYFLTYFLGPPDVAFSFYCSR
jgi:hypothetical protein